MPKERADTKAKLHKRSKHRSRYDFDVLTKSCTDLAPFVIENKHRDRSINFFDPAAVKMLNKAILFEHYNLNYWDIPTDYLCPPIPGRADYIHYMADLLMETFPHQALKNNKINCLDIGMGANCIYPIIGATEYDWNFVGSDIDPIAIEAASKIADQNAQLKNKVACRLQENSAHFFKGIIGTDERFDLSICNPPFHSSAKEAQEATRRKVSNLTKEKRPKVSLNFGGMHNELWTAGGEKKFITDMIKESADFATSCYWFSTLVSKEAHLNTIYKQLDQVKVARDITIEMGQGNKISRVVAWTFFDESERRRLV